MNTKRPILFVVFAALSGLLVDAIHIPFLTGAIFGIATVWFLPFVTPLYNRLSLGTLMLRLLWVVTCSLCFESAIRGGLYGSGVFDFIGDKMTGGFSIGADSLAIITGGFVGALVVLIGVYVTLKIQKLNMNWVAAASMLATGALIPFVLALYNPDSSSNPFFHIFIGDYRAPSLIVANALFVLWQFAMAVSLLFIVRREQNLQEHPLRSTVKRIF